MLLSLLLIVSWPHLKIQVENFLGFINGSFNNCGCFATESLLIIIS